MSIMESIETMKVNNEIVFEPQSYNVLSALLEVKDEPKKISLEKDYYTAILMSVLFLVLSSPWIHNIIKNFSNNQHVIWIVKITFFIVLSFLIFLFV